MEDKSLDFMVNDSVKDFVFDLHQATRCTQSAEEVRGLYRISYRTICDKYFDKAAWPDARAISSQCLGDDGRTPDELFLAIYREMTYRHLFAVTKPSVDDRLDVWRAYLDLFDKILAADDTRTLLTPEWIFDILHEFVYQFQSFCQFRTQVSSRDPDELAALEAAPDCWAAATVYRYLSQLAACGRVREAAARRKGASASVDEALKAGAPSELHYLAGYFAVCALSRLECLLGDYSGAVDAVSMIDLADEAEPFSRVLTCRLNLFYHCGCARLLMRKPRDAAQTFAAALAHVARLDKAGALLTLPGGDQAKKMQDRMLALLAISLVLAPAMRRSIDETTLSMLAEKYQDKHSAMERGDVNTFDEMLNFACPKFVVPSVPDYATPINESANQLKLQARIFREDMERQKHVSSIRSFLKLYTSIGLEKLAKFNDMTADEFRTELVAIKHKMRTAGGAGVDAATVATLDVHYYVQGEMIHIDEPEKEARHEQYFLSQISKCHEVAGDVAKLDVNQ